METKRIVDINTYWATIVKDTAQFGQIAVAENPEFNRLADCIFRALEDSFIHSATEYGVKRWESMLQIAPSAGETLEERKARILTYLNLKLPYTWRVLKQLIECIVGEDKVTLDYVNDESKLVVHTDRLSDEKLQTVRDLIERVVPMNLVVEQYNHHIEISWRDINKYAECKTMLQVSKVNSEWWNDVTSDGQWIYPLTNATSLYDNANFGYLGFFEKTPATHVKVYAPNLTFARYLFCGNKKTKSAYLYLPKLKTSNYLFKDANIEEIDGDLSSFMGGENLCQLCAYCYNLRVFKCTLPRFGVGKNRSVWQAFFRTKLDKPSALRILNSIGTGLKTGEVITSDTLHIGIHIDHQNDAEVRTAIESAEERGFNLSVAWNGTPTSGISTLDLEEIYAKVIECEEGEYTDENGNRCMLDWAHYVTDTTDYKLFFSIYEAEQYFKLTKIEGIEQ